MLSYSREQNTALRRAVEVAMLPTAAQQLRHAELCGYPLPPMVANTPIENGQPPEYVWKLLSEYERLRRENRADSYQRMFEILHQLASLAPYAVKAIKIAGGIGAAIGVGAGVGSIVTQLMGIDPDLFSGL